MGVLDKSTMQMKVHNAQLFSMQPVIPGKCVIQLSSPNPFTINKDVVLVNILFIYAYL